MNLNERQVRDRAYFIWENEGRVFGRAEAHWLQAEAELRGRTPVRVDAVAAESLLAPSPADLHKPRAGRAKASVKAPANVALTDMAAAAKPASKKTAAKPAAAVAKGAAAKSAASKSAAAKPVAAKSVASKTKPRTPRADSTVAVSLH